MAHDSSSTTFGTQAPATRARLRVTLLGVACVAFGLLIWSRLLLVTSYPKTAIAKPAVAANDRGDSAGASERD